ncbi:MAG: 1-phosphofructokinase family hexose kinase [Clostridia bacterium]|nr:1-phosphofructokinase family hexose kinase [Clostridia bacterium]
MILTVCPNPCIDCTIEIEDFKVGRLNRLDGKIENTAGKALNTAVGIKRLGGECVASGFMFETGGRRFERFLGGEGIPYDFVWEKGSVRVNYKIIDGKSMMTEINDRGDTVSEQGQEKLIEKVKKLSENCDMVVISGSLPSGIAPDYYARLIKCVPEGKKVVVDCDGEQLRRCVSAGVYMVKPNVHEVERFFNVRVTSIEDVVSYALQLIDLGAKRALISMGKSGAVFTDGQRTFYSKSVNVAVNSTVGAGDSMLAAACLAIEEGADMPDTLKRAVAAGTASVTTAGTNLFTKDKYLEILNELTVEQI